MKIKIKKVRGEWSGEMCTKNVEVIVVKRKQIGGALKADANEEVKLL